MGLPTAGLVDGQYYITANGVRYQYTLATKKWKIVTGGAIAGQNDLPLTIDGNNVVLGGFSLTAENDYVVGFGVIPKSFNVGDTTKLYIIASWDVTEAHDLVYKISYSIAADGADMALGVEADITAINDVAGHRIASFYKAFAKSVFTVGSNVYVKLRRPSLTAGI
jgi:hypothetical protein